MNLYRYNRIAFITGALIVCIVYIEFNINYYCMGIAFCSFLNSFHFLSEKFYYFFPVSRNICNMIGCSELKYRINDVLFGVWVVSLFFSVVYAIVFRVIKKNIRIGSEHEKKIESEIKLAFAGVILCFYISHISGFDPEMFFRLNLVGVNKERFIIYTQAFANVNLFFFLSNITFARPNVYRPNSD